MGIILVLLVRLSTQFSSQTQRIRGVRISRVCMMALPQDIRSTVSAIKDSTQVALQSRCSRMDVELPPGATLGVEGKKEGNIFSEGESGAVSILRSDRELARVYVEMFRPVGDAIAVAFGTKKEADAARQTWCDDTRVICLDEARKKSIKAATKGKGFAAKMAAATASPAALLPIPANTEVLLAVSPRNGAQFTAIERICTELGMKCCVVLLNARLESASFANDRQREFFLDTFEPVFQLKPASPSVVLEAKQQNKDAVATPILYRAYPDEWTIFSKPVIGAPRLLKKFEDRPTTAEIVETISDSSATEGRGFETQVDKLLGKLTGMVN